MRVLQTLKILLVPILKGAGMTTVLYSGQDPKCSGSPERRKGKILCYINTRWPVPGYKEDFRPSLSPWSKGMHKASWWEGEDRVAGTGNMGRDIHWNQKLKKTYRDGMGSYGSVNCCWHLQSTRKRAAFTTKQLSRYSSWGLQPPPQGVGGSWLRLVGASPDVVLGYYPDDFLMNFPCFIGVNGGI